tara:strand:+ start:967 stop:1602 length:636 start_codon:yes stop_codon:yes gene_type:complete
MSAHKKIAWESWNAIAEEIFMEDLPPEVWPSDEAPAKYIDSHEMETPQEIFLSSPKIIYTPMGPYPFESALKPSDRWDCWIGYTNFDVTNRMANKVEKCAGVEALKIMGRYSFFVGVGKLFDIKDVRATIESELCVYTEQELLSDKDTQATVTLVKKQLESKEYWSILVCPNGNVEYIVSDDMDKVYLDGLSELSELKKNIGGIILRGKNG